jgi:hypothetical protein
MSTPPRAPSPLHAHPLVAPHLLDRSAAELTTANHQPPPQWASPRETLAGIDAPARMQRQSRMTTLGRRSRPNRTAETPYRFAPPPGLAGEPAGLIWPRSGEARPDPAFFFFFPMLFMFSKWLLQIKWIRKSFRPQKIVIQILLWSMQCCLAPGTACSFFRVLNIFW